MLIAIKSETDSRVLLYPMLRTLKNFGSILVLSTNKQLRRLIDEEDGGFRNISVIVEEAGATDDVCQEYGINARDFDYVILDNMGVTEYDVIFLMMGSVCSPEFYENMSLIVDSDDINFVVVQFGKTASKEKDVKPEKPEKQKRKKGSSEDYDPAEKFNSDNEIEQERKRRLKPVVLQFPTFQDIESVEAEHRFYEVPSNLADVFYKTFKDTLAIDMIQFRKEVRKKDESSGYLKSRDAMR